MPSICDQMIGLHPVSPASERSQESTPDLLSNVVSFLSNEGSGTAPPGSLELLTDVADALVELWATRKPRISVRVRIGSDPWEIGLELAGSLAFVSVFASGAVPVVVIHDRPVDLVALIGRLDEGLRQVQKDHVTLSRRARGVREALARLEVTRTPGRPIESSPVVVEAPGELPFSFSAELSMRPAPVVSPVREAAVLKSDLLSLLVRGRFRVAALDHGRELPDVHVFFVAEQLARMVLEALEAQSSGRTVWRTVQVGNAVVGLRLGAPRHNDSAQSSGGVGVTLGLLPKTLSGRGESWTFPLVDLGILADAVVSFGRALARSLVRRERSQGQNLRLVEFKSKLREIDALSREHRRDDTKVNHAPESYRAFAATHQRPKEPDLSRARLRFVPHWQAAIPQIDLRSTFLCGEGLYVGGAREICCIARRSGELVWRHPAGRAVSVMTASGLVRFETDGTLRLHGLDTGEAKWTLRLEPRVGAPVTGAVVSAPALPRILVLSEGKRHIAGVDLESGQLSWRYAAPRAGTFRLKRAGKLVIVASGGQALTALDVLSGDVVWRFCDRSRFSSLASIAEDSLFAVAGDGAMAPRGGMRLHHLDAWSGSCFWSIVLPPHARPVGAPLLGSSNVILASRGPRGTSLLAFDRKSGELRFEREACLGAAAPLLVDDTVVLNSEAGELVAIDANTGDLRYRHVFTDGFEGDRPRRLEPVLRSGALFVPQTSVHVVRPSDGAILGTVTTDLVPDLVRVDERCSVYVAEESGHVTAYDAAAKLTLVR